MSVSRMRGLIALLALMAFWAPRSARAAGMVALDSVPKSGIPSVDSLPLHDWEAAKAPLSYSKAFWYAALIPGGGQFYGGHPVRGGFLVGLEGLLLGDALFSKPAYIRARDRDISMYLDSADAYFAQGMDGSNPDWAASRQRVIDLARKTADLRANQRDDAVSELAWGAGLHFYGICDAMEIVYRSHHPPPSRRSVHSALIRGLLFPGGGQLYNGAYGKFGMLWMTLGAAAGSIVWRQEMVDYYRERVRTAQIEAGYGVGDAADNLGLYQKELTLYRKRRNQYFWGIGIFYVYAILDGMVDAALHDFDSPGRYAALPDLEPGPRPYSAALSWHF